MSVALLNKLGVYSIDVILREKRLRWYRLVERSSGAINSAYHMQVVGNDGRGRLRMTWKEVSSKYRAARHGIWTLWIHLRGLIGGMLERASCLETGLIDIVFIVFLYL